MAQKAGAPVPAIQSDSGLKKRLFAPLAVFKPQRRIINGRMQEDWSMPWLATGVFLLFLASVSSRAFAIPFRLEVEISFRVSTR